MVSKRPLRRNILVSGIPGTGKTTFGNTLASGCGFAHYDLENAEVLRQFFDDPERFISRALEGETNVVVTWGFFPDEKQIRLVKHFRERGFQLVWFDGNRSAALREFRRRGTVDESLFHAQIARINGSHIIEQITPLVIDSFDVNGNFKDVSALLREIEERSSQVAQP